MDTIQLPSPEEVSGRLQPLAYPQLHELSRLSGVPFTTLLKVRSGETSNPGLATVRAFLPHVEAAAAWQPPSAVGAGAPAQPRPTSSRAQAERSAASEFAEDDVARAAALLAGERRSEDAPRSDARRTVDRPRGG